MKIGDLPKLSSGMKLAFKMSLVSDHPYHPVGAAIMSNGKILSSGCNQGFKTHTYVKRNGPKNGHCNNRTIHAELAAIFKIKNKSKLNGAIMFVYRHRKDGTFGMSRPCCMCMDILKHYGFKKIVYTTEDGIVEEKI